MTTSHKLSSSLTGKASVLTLSLLMVASVLFTAPSAMAQQTTATTLAPTTIPPLTPQEQQQQDRLQNTIAATTRNLMQGQKQVGGIVDTPRWSNPVWVQPNSLSILFAYCLPGEFADSGQQILGGSEMDILESYSLAVTNDVTGWLMVVENQNQTDRLPAAVGVICSSDANEPETRVLSPQEQTVINNIIQQFITIRTTQITNITQVINIINNVTTNGTGGVTPPPPTNNTGGGGNTTEPLTVQAVIDIDQDATPVVVFEASIDGGTPPYTCHWDLGDGTTSDACGVSHIYENPGTYTATVTVTDSVGQTASDSVEGFLITPPTGNGTGGTTTTPPLTNDTGGETITTLPPPTTGGETAVPPTTGGETAAPPTTIDTLGQ
jgi:PKD repeat protein